MPNFKSKSTSVGHATSPFDPKLGAATKVCTVPGLFTDADQIAADAEGWFVGYDPEAGMYDILDNLTLTFSTSSEARGWVEKRADQGSDLHERALAATVALTIRNAGKK